MTLYGAAKAPAVLKSSDNTTVKALTDNSGGTSDQTLAAIPAGGIGVAAGGWDTAANRDIAITNINNNIADLAKKISDLIDHMNDGRV